MIGSPVSSGWLCCGRQIRSEFGEFSEVLGGGGEQELAPGASWPMQPQPVEPEDALEIPVPRAAVVPGRRELRPAP